MSLFSGPSRVLQAGVAPLAAVLLIAVAAPGATILTTPPAQPGAQPAALPPVLTATLEDDALAAPAATGPDDLEAQAIALADEFGAVPVDESGRLCPIGDLTVGWDEPDGYTHGAYIGPLGPRPTGTDDVNGVVVCSGSTWAYMGFEAQRDGAAWTVTAVPYVSEGEGHGENLNLDADVPAPEPEHADEEPQATDPAPRDEPAPTAPLEGVATSAWLAGLGAIESYAAYEPQSACSPTAKAGAVTMKDTLLGTYPATRNLGIARACHLGGRSEHKEGRAFDWGAYVSRPVERASVEQFLTQLLATDADGNRHALARRMGVMYVIWNGQIWSAYRPGDGWRHYRGPNPHTDHVHVSLSRAGGAARTSFFTQGLGAKGVLSQVPPGASAINTAATIAAPTPSAPAPSATTVGHRRAAPGAAPSEPTAGTRRRSDARQTDGGDADRRERFREAAARREQEQAERRERRAAAGEQWRGKQEAREAAGEKWRAQRETREAGATERRQAWKQAQAEEEARRTERRQRKAAEEAQQRAEWQERKAAEEARRTEWRQRKAAEEEQRRADEQAAREADLARQAEEAERQREPEEAVSEPEVTGSAEQEGRDRRWGKRDGGGRKRGRNR